MSDHTDVGARAPYRPTRRAVLKVAGAGLAASALTLVEPLVWLPERVAAAMPDGLPDIQHDIGAYLAPARSIDGVMFRFGPVHTLFVTFALQRLPSRAEQNTLAWALDRVEEAYPFSPEGMFCSLAYGLPYFGRLTGGLSSASRRIPRLLTDTSRLVLEEAVPAPTDVVPGNGIVKQHFNVPVRIEQNDMLLTLRSDRSWQLYDVYSWMCEHSDTLNGERLRSPRLSSLCTVTSVRAMFVQPGLPRRLADELNLPYASRINDRSPMWMGFADQQVSGGGPAAITTFAGNESACLTTAVGGDYFDNGSIQVLNHVILDLPQFYADSEPYTERVQYMFRSDPIPSVGNTDQYTSGGGPAYLPNEFKGAGDAERNARGIGTYQGERRMGHVTGLQRSSRAADGTPLHIRADGPGYDSMDVPGATPAAKLQFSAFLPTADRFRRMRRDQASLDLVQKYGVASDDNGLERFSTATRRQNFLSPPRRHRVFPLLELS